ncbi:hypothetical protein [Bradyrhizobium sp. WSM4349]|uniref:hypothetical protein n=1 Tax=Bradyrhizobium sp. WSM4349 TaxID=1040988 RepID=UPI0012FC277A|nr:hypothetical protein [Bradyrhizobium sp. WSM4349]
MTTLDCIRLCAGYGYFLRDSQPLQEARKVILGAELGEWLRRLVLGIWIDAYLQGIFRREVRHRIELQHSSTSIYRSKQISFVCSGNAEMVKEIGLAPPILHLGSSVVAFCIVGDALE